MLRGRRIPSASFALLASVAACGRIGFDAAGDGDTDGPTGDGDGDGDGEPALRCQASQVMGVDLGPQTPVRGMAVAGTTTGFALAFLRGDHTALDGLVLDANLAPNVPVPQRSTPVVGVNSDYVAVQLHAEGSQIIGAVTASDGALYLKTFPPDMSLFLSNTPTPLAYPADPLVQPLGAQRVAIVREPDEIVGYRLDASGEPGDGIVRFTDTRASTLTTGNAAGEAFAIADHTDGTCAAYTFPAAPRVGRVTPIAGACRAAHLAQSGTELRLVFLDASAIAVRRGLGVDADVFELDPPVTIPDSEPDTMDALAGPRAAFTGGRGRYVWLAPSGFATARDASTGLDFDRVAITGLPPGRPDAWQLAAREDGARVFAAYGDALWTFPLCD